MTYNKKRLIFTVTNDLSYDQRMIRICTSLQANGYNVLLVGRKLRNSILLNQFSFSQKRLSCFTSRGILFYAEYNTRLFFFLLMARADLFCAIDLDTILPCFLISVLRNKKRVYDAHELFTEMKEVISRPVVHSIWKSIESFTVPHFKPGYTVSEPIREIFKKQYKVDYKLILNVPLLTPSFNHLNSKQYIIYQGAVNEGRSFETLIPAFQWIEYPIHIYGDGNFLEQAKSLVLQYNLEEKVILKGKFSPDQLVSITSGAVFGITLFENAGLSNYYSLANRFFDYIHAGIPQLCVDYPVYRQINKEFEVAVLIDDLSSKNIAAAINRLLSDHSLQQRLSVNCMEARKVYNWQNQEKELVNFYNKVFSIE